MDADGEEQRSCWVSLKHSIPHLPSHNTICCLHRHLGRFPVDKFEPERILARLNDELAADNPSGMFVTFLCAVFEPGPGRLTLANGGHCRPVLLSAGQSPRWAVKNLGTALGFEPGLEFERTELTLRAGDTLIFYTDGVSEAFNPQEECYGNDRLLADAGGFAGQSAPGITAELLKNIRAFAGTAPQSDDIAIMVLKVNGAPGRPAGREPGA